METVPDFRGERSARFAFAVIVVNGGVKEVIHFETPGEFVFPNGIFDADILGKTGVDFAILSGTDFPSVVIFGGVVGIPPKFKEVTGIY